MVGATCSPCMNSIIESNSLFRCQYEMVFLSMKMKTHLKFSNCITTCNRTYRTRYVTLPIEVLYSETFRGFESSDALVTALQLHVQLSQLRVVSKP